VYRTSDEKYMFNNGQTPRPTNEPLKNTVSYHRTNIWNVKCSIEFIRLYIKQ